MPAATTHTTGTVLEYETFGASTDPAVLLVIGFQTQLVGWDERFCALLAASGFYVIRFDNRDIGLSTKVPESSDPIDVEAAFVSLATGAAFEAPYSLSDLAADCVGLLDALGIPAAHIVGGSMGGFIAHRIALEHPERVLSLTSLMSTTLEPEYLPDPAGLAGMLQAPTATRAEAIAAAVAGVAFQAGPTYFDAAYAAERAALALDRAPYPQSAPRQLAAIAASGSPVAQLKNLRVRTLVIHGRADPLIPVQAAERTAQVIPGAHLLLLDGMGHDLPPQLFALVAGAITGHMSSAMQDPSPETGKATTR